MNASLRIRAWREDPTLFVRDNFGVVPDEWQKDALAAIGGKPNPRRKLVMKACTGPGKSAVLAWIGWQRLVCFAARGEHPKGAALSGEGRDNLQDNLFAELAKWQNRSEFLKAAFVWTKSQVYAKDHPETWFLSARSFPKDANAESIGQSLSGLHSAYPFILLDETGSAPIVLGQRAEQIFTGGVVDGLVAQAGNPTDSGGLLYASSVAGDATVITITAAPDDPKRTPRVPVEHARAMITKYGLDNAWVKSTILGEFPDSAINTLLSLDDVERSMAREYHEEDFKYSQKRLGVDCARFGMDATYLAPRQGLVAHNPVEMRGARSNEIAARIMVAKQNWNYEIEFIDSTGGWGSGVADSLIQSGQSPHEINFGSRAPDNKYKNMRAYMWFMMANWIKRGGKLPNNPAFIKQFTTPTYTFTADGKFQLEEKDQIKKRLGFSPDYADALALTFAMPETPGGVIIPANLLGAFQAEEGIPDWSPFESND